MSNITDELQSKIIIDNFKLPIDVTIGNGTFKKGVHVKHVIDRLIRQFDYNDNPIAYSAIKVFADELKKNLAKTRRDTESNETE